MRFAVKVSMFFVLAASMIMPSMSRAELAAGYVMENTGFSAGYAQFTAYNDQLHAWHENYGYRIYNVDSGSTISIGKPSNGVLSNGYGDAFGVLDPLNDKFYAGTYNTFDSSYVYTYGRTEGTWNTDVTGTQAGVLMTNTYGAQAHNGQLYISALIEPWSGGFGQDTYILAYDHNAVPGGDTPRHDPLIKTEGNSAYLAISPNGDIYYGTYQTSVANCKLYRWTAEQVASATQDLYDPNAVDTVLTLADAEILLSLPGAGNGLAVDKGGNVFFAVNDYEVMNSGGVPIHTLGMYDPMAPNGYREIFKVEDYFSEDGGYAHFGAVSVDGDFLNGGTLYFAGNGSSITSVRAIPEPAAISLMLMGIMCLLASRRTTIK